MDVIASYRNPYSFVKKSEILLSYIEAFDKNGYKLPNIDCISEAVLYNTSFSAFICQDIFLCSIFPWSFDNLIDNYLYNKSNQQIESYMLAFTYKPSKEYLDIIYQSGENKEKKLLDKDLYDRVWLELEDLSRSNVAEKLLSQFAKYFINKERYREAGFYILKSGISVESIISDEELMKWIGNIDDSSYYPENAAIYDLVCECLIAIGSYEHAKNILLDIDNYNKGIHYYLYLAVVSRGLQDKRSSFNNMGLYLAERNNNYYCYDETDDLNTRWVVESVICLFFEYMDSSYRGRRNDNRIVRFLENNKIYLKMIEDVRNKMESIDKKLGVEIDDLLIKARIS